MLAQREIFRKTAVKSTIFELQQSFLHIFGVAQNFQFNDGGFMSQIYLRAVSGPEVYRHQCIAPKITLLSISALFFSEKFLEKVDILQLLNFICSYIFTSE